MNSIAKRSHNNHQLSIERFVVQFRALRVVSSTKKFGAVELRGETPEYENEPKRTQTNPIFWRPKPILRPKMRIFDKFRKTFLCKTNPMVCNRYSNCRGV